MDNVFNFCTDCNQISSISDRFVFVFNKLQININFHLCMNDHDDSPACSSVVIIAVAFLTNSEKL